MLVAMPSKDRVGRVSSRKIVPSATLFVPENEAEAYRMTYGPPVVSVPQEVRGITRTRNWILDHTRERWVVFVDDDAVRCGYVFFLPHRVRNVLLAESAILEEWGRLFEVMEDAGFRIWGVDTLGQTRSIYPFRPIITRTYVTASCMGMLNRRGFRFDETFPVKEDYELCLRCLRDDGGVVGARYFYWYNRHWKDPGGCADYRTVAMELETIRRLSAMYPGMIRRVTKGGSTFSIMMDF